jgi:hypothetical protein
LSVPDFVPDFIIVLVKRMSATLKLHKKPLPL